MPYIPGNAAEGYCLECKQDTVQTVLEVEGMQVRLARCEKCGAEAPLVIPRHKTKAGLRAALKKDDSGTRKRRTRRSENDPGKAFRSAIEGKDISSARGYSIRIPLTEGDVVRHKRFGVGVVTHILESSKAVILFEDGPRTLIYGRG